MNFNLIKKRILMLAVVACVGVPPALANDGLYTVRANAVSGWKSMPLGSDGCGVSARFEDGYQTNFLKKNEVNSFELVSPSAIFLTGQAYAFDFYIGETMVHSASTQSATGKSLSFPLPAGLNAYAALDENYQMALGVADTLYIFEYNNLNLNYLEDCNRPVVAEKSAVDRSIDVVAPPKMSPAAVNLTPNAPRRSYPLDVDSSAPYVAPTNGNSVSLGQPEQGALSEMPASGDAYKGASAPMPEVVLRGNTVEIEDVSDSRHTPETLHIKRSLNSVDAKTKNEEKELIESLMRKITILEREKEVLRSRSSRATSSVEVLRSCAKERAIIDDLNLKLEALRVDRVDILRDLQIKEDQCLPFNVDSEMDNIPDFPPENMEISNEQNL